MRDLHVQLRTLGKLRAGNKIRRTLLRQQEHSFRKLPELRAAVRGMLGRSRGAMEAWPLKQTTPASLQAGLKRVYKQGRTAFKIARRNPAPEHLHEWRKKAKALGYGLELIERLAPKKLFRELERCQTLGEVLGDSHDLFMVLEALRHANQSKSTGDFAGLSRRIRVRRAKLQKKAFKLGKKIYNEKPRAFGGHLDHVMAALKKQKGKQ